MNTNSTIKCGKFKGRDRKEVLELIRAAERDKSKQSSKKSRKRNKAVDNDLNKTYRSWQSVSGTCRSFFIWKGRYSKSSKEGEIHRILKSTNLTFYREVSFDLRKRFDFYIPLIDLVIEYDGGQHFNNFGQMDNDIEKEKMLTRLGVKLIRYNRTHNLSVQIPHDLIHHSVLK